MQHDDLNGNLFGVVVIGRNEGERLKTCLTSIVGESKHIVYVDSGSTDDSVGLALTMGVAVAELDMTIPFTAARARNEGADRLMQLAPDIEYIQFVDGDCEMVASWFAKSQQAMSELKAGVVFGRLKERYPDASIYNHLCDIEWDVPVGECSSCGGIALIRLSAFRSVSGFDPNLIAGEEPEMCVRLRRAGWHIYRIDADMALHDASMTRFAQWWKRAVRAGHAYAEGASLHGASPEKHWVKEVRSNWLWGVSFAAILLVALLEPVLLGLLLIYPVQMWRIYRRANPQWTPYERKLYAVFCVLAKLPLMLGQMKFCWNAMAGQKSKLIEYK